FVFFYSTRKLWGRALSGARYLALERGGFARRNAALVAGAAALAVIAVLVPLPHHVTVDAVLAPADPRAVVAPHDGRVEAVFARAGEPVAAGEVLAVVAPPRARGDAAAARAHSDALASAARRARTSPWD